MKFEKHLSFISMILGISALFIFPGIIIIEVLCRIESLPLNYSVLMSSALIFAVLSCIFSFISQKELQECKKSVIAYKIMSVTGIVCSVMMVALFTLSAIFMILEKLQIIKLFD